MSYTKCQHERTTPVYKVVSDKRRYYRQCLTCGSLSSQIPAAEAGNHTFTEYDSEAQLRYSRKLTEEWKEEQDRKRDAENREWWARYESYMRSPEWARRRQRVLDRDRHVCQACLSNRATQVHHKSYKHLGREPLFDLESVCDACHSLLHPREGGWTL